MDDDRQHKEEEEVMFEYGVEREEKKETLLIKLKIPNGGLKDKEKGLSTEVRDLDVRKCEYCGKEFMNGKALGGHVRIHNQEGKGGGGGSSKKKLKRKMDELGEHGQGGNGGGTMGYTCCICHRWFPTNKSLCGHMRFHPERGWRGVQPPRALEGEGHEVGDCSHSEVPTLAEECKVDLLKDLRNWSKTERRGRISSTEFAPGAVLGLMKLAMAISGELSSPDGRWGSNGVPGSMEEEEEEGGRKITEEPEGPSKSNKKAGSRLRFECITCHKVFPSFQALGGHRSVHNKDRGAVPHPPKVVVVVPGNDGNGCETYCEKSSTGRSASPADETSSTGPRVVLPIDLNELPTVDNEKEAS